jgi:flagellar biosynthetic protein FliQ
MTYTIVVDLVRSHLITLALVAGPLLVVALLVGLMISLLQALTQVQESTITFVPKVAIMGIAFLVGLPFFLGILVRYTTEIFRQIPTMGQ